MISGGKEVLLIVEAKFGDDLLVFANNISSRLSVYKYILLMRH